VIEWTDKTFNPWLGCSRVSPACAHCYADTLARNRMGLKLWGDDAPRKLTSDSNWRKPLTWNRKSPEEHGRPTRVFCASMADVFEDRPELRLWRSRLWNLIEQTPNLHWQLLTKRPENVARMAPWWSGWSENVWLGTSIENARFSFRADLICAHPASVHFLSIEPLLGSVFRSDGNRTPLDLTHIEWVITGGESGPGFRPFDTQWLREIRDACLAGGVAYFHKQNGGIRPKASGKELDGREWCEFPASQPLAA
jgi:protein gp37